MSDLHEIAHAARSASSSRKSTSRSCSGAFIDAFSWILFLAGIAGTSYLAYREVHRSRPIDPAFDQRPVEITALQAENAKLRDILAKAANVLQRVQQNNAQAAAQAAAPPAQNDAETKIAQKIDAAMARHELADGMTLAQAQRSLSLEFKKMNEENSDGADYVAVADRRQLPFRMIPGFGMTGGQIVGTQYRIHVKDGIVTYWSKSGFSLDPGTAAVGDSRIP